MVSDFDSLGAFWSSLTSSGDFNPPLHYLAIAGARALGAGEELAVRMPSVLGLVGAMAATYLLISRLTSPLYGWVAALFVARQARYGVEGRPYALMLCFLALLLWLWQRRIEGAGGRFELAGIGAVTALGISTHFYFGLALGPLLAAELVRWLRRRRADPPLALALGVGLLPLAAYLPIVAYFRDFSARGYWSTFQPGAVGKTYDLLTDGWRLTWQPLALLLALRLLRPGWLPRSEADRRRDDVDGPGAAGRRHPIPVEMWIVMVGLSALPLLAALGAWATGGHYTPRHYLPACLGLAGLTSLLAWTLARGARAVGVVLLVAMLLPAAGAASRELAGARGQRHHVDGLTAWLLKAAGGKPALTCGPLEALRLAERAAAAGAPPPVVYCRADKRIDSPDRSLLALSGRVPLPMLPLAECFRAYEGHLLLDRAARPAGCFSSSWKLPTHRIVPTKQRRGADRLYRVVPDDSLIFADGFESGALDRWR